MCLVGRERDNNNDEGFLKSQDAGDLDSIYTIIVEGNVASGKTTFVNLFKGYQQVFKLIFKSVFLLIILNVHDLKFCILEFQYLVRFR